MSVKYPSALDNIESLFGGLTDTAQDKLASAINNSVLTFSLSNASKFPLTRHIILIQDELIIVSSRTGNVLTIEQRGAFGTVAAAHGSQIIVSAIYSAAHHNTLVEALMKIQSETENFRSPFQSLSVIDPSTLTPTLDQHWIVPVGAVGDWSGKDNQIAFFNGINWSFITPKNGYQGYVISEKQNFIYDNTIVTGSFYWKTNQGEQGPPGPQGLTFEVVPVTITTPGVWTNVPLAILVNIGDIAVFDQANMEKVEVDARIVYGAFGANTVEIRSNSLKTYNVHVEGY